MVIKSITSNTLIVFTSLFYLTSCSSEGEQKASIDYPQPPKTDVVDTYFQEVVPDPYRWMENLNADSVEHWVDEENQVFDQYMEQIGLKSNIQGELRKLWDYPKYSSPYRSGDDQYFFYKNEGLQDQSVLYHLDSLNAKPSIFLDPNTFSEDGTTSLSSTSPSPEGEYLAYSISKAGSDWREIFVKNIETGEKLDDHLKNIKFSGISWVDSGFYYSRYNPDSTTLSGRNKNHKVYFHKVGTDQDEDRLVYSNPKKPFVNYSAQTIANERFLVIYATKGASGKNQLLIKDLKSNNQGFKVLVPHFKHSYSVVGHHDGKLLVKTNKDAPKYRLMAIDPENPKPSNWSTLIPEKEKAVMETVSNTGNRLLVKYMKDASSRLKVFDMEGNLQNKVNLPTMGNVSGFGGREEDSVIFFTFQSFVHPPTIYRYDIIENKKTVFRKSQADIDPKKYKTRQITYESTDGTKVPMFIVHQKDLNQNGENPAFLYGYGGFNITIKPNFDISRSYFLKRGGVLAIPNLRGGGVYGESWHKAGMKQNKQQVFDDFKQAGQYLFDEGYTDKDHLAISGRSNGGLLVGAAMTQNPEMFEVALPAVGVMDMLRFHKFTIGWAWASEYGSSEDSTAFENLYDYSPYHNLEPQTCYPATLVTTADHDDRVVPAHSFKFTARLQEYQACQNPTLISIETQTGHGAGKPVSKTIKQAAEKWAFTFHHLGIEPQNEAL